MGRWCPTCGAEYVEGWGTCSNCGVELVGTPPPKPAGSGIIDAQVVTERGEDPFIAIWEGPTPEGRRFARRIERALIPFDLGDAPEPGRVRIEVPASYRAEAVSIIRSDDGTEPSEDDVHDEDADLDLSEEPARWSWGSLVVVIIAVGLIVLLLLTSR